MPQDKTAHNPLFLIDLNAQDTDKEKIKISPIGQSVGIDGRVFNIDEERVLEATQKAGIDIVLNVNHGYDQYRDKAAGWIDINSLEVREDGIYGSINLTDIGEKLISKKHYRYLSPEYHIQWNGDIREVRDIAGVGLVNRPNLLDKSLNQIEGGDSDQDKTNNKEQEVSKPTDKELELQTQLDKQKEVNKQLEDDAKKLTVEHAVESGELLPNKQEFALSLNGESLNQFLKIEKENNKHLATGIAPDDTKPELSEAEKEVNRQLGLTDDKGDK